MYIYMYIYIYIYIYILETTCSLREHFVSPWHPARNHFSDQVFVRHSTWSIICSCNVTATHSRMCHSNWRFPGSRQGHQSAACEATGPLRNEPLELWSMFGTSPNAVQDIPRTF